MDWDANASPNWRAIMRAVVLGLFVVLGLVGCAVYFAAGLFLATTAATTTGFVLAGALLVSSAILCWYFVTGAYRR